MKYQFGHKIHPLKSLTSALLIFFMLYFIGCAATAPPPGGPKDTEGPKLISSSPQNGSVNISPTTEIEFTFSEAISPRSVANSVVVRPALSSETSIDVSGNTVRINFQDSLQSQTTYIVSLGRSLKDYRDNPVQKNVQVAFSTGDQIDQNKITGKIYHVSKENQIKVLAWNKKRFQNDSLKKIAPDYLTAVDSTYSFSLTNLSSGTYYLLAVSSSRNSFQKVSSQDKVALPNIFPIKVSRDSTVQNISFYMTDDNLLQRFRVKRIETEGQYVKATFNQPIAQKNWSNVEMSIDDSIHAIYKWRDDKKPKQLKAYFDSLQADTNLTCTINNLLNRRQEKILAPQDQKNFNFRPKKDTIKPALQSAVPKNKSSKVKLNAPIYLNFTEPIRNIDSTDISFFNGADSTTIDWRKETIDANSIKIVPAKELEVDQNYFIKIHSQNWEDLLGNSFQDSIVTIKFNTVNKSNYGYLSGTIEGISNLNPTNIYLRANKIDGNYSSSIKLTETGNFKFNDLFAGNYTLSLWYDKNGNGIFDTGSLFPPTSAEYYQSFPQTIKIRPRWEKSGIKLEIQ